MMCDNHHLFPLPLFHIFPPPPYCQYLLGGLAQIDVEDWKRNTEYVGYSPYENIIVWFWKVRALLPQI